VTIRAGDRVVIFGTLRTVISVSEDGEWVEATMFVTPDVTGLYRASEVAFYDRPPAARRWWRWPR
jgi:hypothetical protein